MLQLNPEQRDKILYELFEEDIERGAPPELILYYAHEELVPYDAFIDGDFPDEEELLYQRRPWLN